MRKNPSYAEAAADDAGASKTDAASSFAKATKDSQRVPTLADRMSSLPVGMKRQNPAGACRGLRAEDLPGRNAPTRQMRFALMKRGLWPPAAWKVPVTLEGVALQQMLEERANMCVEPWKAARKARRAARKGTEPVIE